MSVEYGSLPFAEQIDFFRRKLNLPTRAWTDVYGEEHDWAFVVAGANRDAIVADFREAVEKAIADGATLEDFRRDFDRIVAAHGWRYRGGREWRSRVIYETNLRGSYMAGRYQQLLAVRDERPYWQYLHNDAVEHPRAQHRAWHGLILRWDDPWWRFYFPVNAWGCQCSVRALGEDDLKRMGKAGPDTAPPIEWETREIGRPGPDGPRQVRVPKGIDPGFEYAPGLARLDSAIPPPRRALPTATVPARTVADPLPPPRSAPAHLLLPVNLDADAAIRRFLGAFGASPARPAILRDVIGERLVIGRALFIDRRSGELSADIAEQASYLMLFAEVLQRPAEIWTRIEWTESLNKAIVRRLYLGRFKIAGSSPRTVMVTLDRDGWTGAVSDDPDVADRWRVGMRLYRRGGG